MGNAFASLFGRSPIQPLQTHYSKVYDCVLILPDFFTAVIEKEWGKAAELQQAIVKEEEEADELKKELRLNLPNGLFMSIPRQQILDLLKAQDKVANKARDIAGLILGRKLEIPEAIAPLMQEYVKKAINSAGQAKTAIDELDELVETGFGGHESQIIEEMIEKLNNIEDENDKQQVVIRSTLYNVERDLFPVDVMFLYKIIEAVGDLADRAGSVGSQLQMLIAR